MVHWWVLVHRGPTWLPHQLDEPKYEWYDLQNALTVTLDQYGPPPRCFSYLQHTRLKNSHSYEIGTYHTIFLTFMMSLDFLSHDDRFFQAWAASNNSTSKFWLLPRLQNWGTWETCQHIQGAQNTGGLRTVPNTGDDFFCPKIDVFRMVLYRVTLDGQLWPSICSSSRLGFL